MDFWEINLFALDYKFQSAIIPQIYCLYLITCHQYSDAESGDYGGGENAFPSSKEIDYPARLFVSVYSI